MGSSKQRIHKRRGVRRLNLQGGTIGSNGVVSVDTSIKASNEPINSITPVYTNNGNPVKELQWAMIDNEDNLSLSIEYFEWLRTLTGIISQETLKESPSINFIQQLAGIASHIARTNDIHANYKYHKAKYEAVYG